MPGQFPPPRARPPASYSTSLLHAAAALYGPDAVRGDRLRPPPGDKQAPEGKGRT